MTSPERFSRLWNDLGARGDPAPVHANLAARHAEPQRHYHTLTHVAQVLHELDRVRARLARPAEAEAALWFHDAVYDPRATDNELRSAGLAREALGGAGVGNETLDRIAGLILDTRHGEAPSDPDARLVVDADLSILGAAPARFERYETQVRQEYAWVAEEDFRQGRARILRLFLDRPTVYLTDEFRRRYETAAQSNLRRSLTQLGIERA